MKVVFMGTPDFAAESLNALISEGYDICAVFCQPDKASGRGMDIKFCPVKELALKNNIDVYQPQKLRDGEAFKTISEISPDILVVVAYGKIIPDDILGIPKYGAINVHGSLLPKYRGAAPIQWSVINGDEYAGVTTMYLASEMDTGDMIFSEKTPVGEFETSGELYDRLKIIGSKLLVKTLRAIEDGTAPRIPQDHSVATYVTMLDKSMCPIDFNKTPREVLKQIYGLQPWPVATWNDLKVFTCEYTDTKTDKNPGEVVSTYKGIEIACAGGETILLTSVQAPGKKRMSAEDYLRGHKIDI